MKDSNGPVTQTRSRRRRSTGDSAVEREVKTKKERKSSRWKRWNVSRPRKRTSVRRSWTFGAAQVAFCESGKRRTTSGRGGVGVRRLRQHRRRDVLWDMSQRVRGKRNVAVMGFTTAGDVFCRFHSVVVTREDIVKAPNAFASFKSHGRCATPQGFVVKTSEGRDLPLLFEQDSVWTFAIGLGCGPFLCFVVIRGFVPSVCHKMTKPFEGIQETMLMGGEMCLEDVLAVCIFSHLMAVARE